MRLDPGYGNVMMGTNLLKKATDVLNDVLVAARLDGDNPEEAHAVFRRRQTGLEEIPSETRIHLRA